MGSYQVGNIGGRALSDRWNGKVWKLQNTPNAGGPTSQNELNGVAATLSGKAWAVGGYYKGEVERTLVERWNGNGWKVQKSPNRGSPPSGRLLGVAASSGRNAWAVGYYFRGTTARTLILRRIDHTWRVQKSPNAGAATTENWLWGVAATSAKNAWAVGYSCRPNRTGCDSTGATYRTLIEHWNGKVWKLQNSPNAGGSTSLNYLSGVAATSGKNAWAVGHYTVGNNSQTAVTLIEHWNGKAWQIEPHPNPVNSGPGGLLSGVAATSPSNAWAVGSYYKNSFGGDVALIEHWNGTAWTVQKSPNTGGDLFGVSATSSRNAWAVGSGRHNLALHWDGQAWTG